MRLWMELSGANRPQLGDQRRIWVNAKLPSTGPVACSCLTSPSTPASWTPMVRWAVRQPAWFTARSAWANPEPRSLDRPDTRV